MKTMEFSNRNGKYIQHNYIRCMETCVPRGYACFALPINISKVIQTKSFYNRLFEYYFNLIEV